MINNSLIQFGVFHEILSVDESMVPYFGRHSAKMFIRGKPIRFGYKIWSLCGIDGYPYHLKIYQGKERSANATTQQEPLGTRVRVDLMDRLLETYRPVIREKKWYWPLFINLLNVSVVAAWRIHCILEKANKLSHLEFRRYIALCLLKAD